ncbi:hypothetical protein BMS3Bbin15_00040 [archaeon BMS3Bbin15]|nr:hypothetical protein BMS3Bbin15_00040 [archaeon BMS3Bbin15]
MSKTKIGRNYLCPCGSGKKYKKCCMEKDKGPKKITETRAWREADFALAKMAIPIVMPFFGELMDNQQKIGHLKEIIEGCPQHYPSLLALGFAYILEDEEETAKYYLDRGFETLKEHFSKDDVVRAYNDLCDFLVEKFMPMLAVEYYTHLASFLENPADAYNNMARALAYLGCLEKAEEKHRKAIALDPEKATYYSDLGYTLMMKGNLREAEEILDKALILDRNDEQATNNYMLCKIMTDNKINNLNAYFLRPHDYERFIRLEEEDDWEKIARMTTIYNSDRLKAFEYHLAKDSSLLPAKKFDIFYTLVYIMEFIARKSESSDFLYDDIAKVESDFKSIMHMFILETDDIDYEIFDDVYEALLTFYDYLSDHKVITREGFRRLKKEMSDLRPELLEKMVLYNEVRHNDDMSEGEKERIRKELFKDDHILPFL